MARKSSRTTEQPEKAQNQNMDTAKRAVLDKAVGDILNAMAMARSCASAMHIA
ncbi:MAG: hypothetical protein V9G12_06855 [Microthrixaceae bacterium]